MGLKAHDPSVSKGKLARLKRMQVFRPPLRGLEQDDRLE
jgi:hypothetical protein